MGLFAGFTGSYMCRWGADEDGGDSMDGHCSFNQDQLETTIAINAHILQTKVSCAVLN